MKSVKDFPVTLLLAVLDIFLTAVISIPLGVYIAIKKNSIADNVLTIRGVDLYSDAFFLAGHAADAGICSGAQYTSCNRLGLFCLFHSPGIYSRAAFSCPDYENDSFQHAGNTAVGLHEDGKSEGRQGK